MRLSVLLVKYIPWADVSDDEVDRMLKKAGNTWHDKIFVWLGKLIGIVFVIGGILGILLTLLSK